LCKTFFRAREILTFAPHFMMTPDQDIQRIYTKGFELFKQFGIKAVTMDQISQACGISKRTLYKHVDNKQDYLKKAFLFIAEVMHRELHAALNSANGNAIDELFAIEKFAELRMRGEEDKLIFQLGYYYPEVASILKKKREEIVFSFTRTNLNKGIDEGTYRNDLHIEHIAMLYYGHILALHESVISDTTLDLDDLRNTSLKYHIRGIASAKGLEYLNKLIQTEQ
jgi:AcrR family transcriptional regulator